MRLHPPPARIVYLVRRAEKDLTAGLPDPPLTAASQARAQALVGALRQAHPTALFSINAQRTRATLAPLATATGLAPRLYETPSSRGLRPTRCAAPTPAEPWWW